MCVFFSYLKTYFFCWLVFVFFTWRDRVLEAQLHDEVIEERTAGGVPAQSTSQREDDVSVAGVGMRSGWQPINHLCFNFLKNCF